MLLAEKRAALGRSAQIQLNKFEKRQEKFYEKNSQPDVCNYNSTPIKCL